MTDDELIEEARRAYESEYGYKPQNVTLVEKNESLTWLIFDVDGKEFRLM